MSGGQGCFQYQVKAAIRCAPARTGEPPARVPHAKTVPRTVSSPLLRFCKEKNFAPCAERPKVSPLDSTAFEKAGEILLSGRRFSKTFRFFCPTESFSYPYNRNSAKLLPGQASKEIIARPARICSAAARAAIRCAPARTGEPPARVPHAKTVPRTVSSPLLRFCKEKNFAPCAERPKTLSLDSAAFEKAGETLNVGINSFSL